MDGVVFRHDFQGVLLRCIEPGQTEFFIEEFHGGFLGGHFSTRTTTLKIMKASYYWLDIFKDSFSWVRKCEKCALFASK